MELLIIVIVVILSLLLWKWKSKNMIIMPGPKGLPLFGNFFQLGNSSHLQLTKWKKQYGDVYKIHILGTDSVVVSGEEAIRDILVHRSDSFAGRPYMHRVNLAHKGGFYISMGDISDRWKRLKKLVVNSLGMYGSGLNRLEEISREELNDLMNHLQDQVRKDEPFDIKMHLQTVMANIDFILCCGQKLRREEVIAFSETEKETLPLLSPTGKGCELEMAPWLRLLPNPTVEALRCVERANAAIFDPAILQRKATLKDGFIKSFECVVDRLFSSNNGRQNDEQFNDLDIRATVEDLCTAGISTSASAVYAFLAICVENPNFQTELQEEIDENIGSRWPSLSDKSKLPLLEASMLEMFRYVSIVPLLVPHKTTKDVELDAYKLPRDTMVLVNLWSLHHDERYWTDPFVFKPSRFLSEDGSLVPPSHPNRRRLLPFGAGRRVCVGETLAKCRIFLVIATLLQRYTFLSHDEGKDSLPVTDPTRFEVGIVLYTPSFLLRVKPRT